MGIDDRRGPVDVSPAGTRNSVPFVGDAPAGCPVVAYGGVGGPGRRRGRASRLLVARRSAAGPVGRARPVALADEGCCGPATDVGDCRRPSTCRCAATRGGFVRRGSRGGSLHRRSPVAYGLAEVRLPAATPRFEPDEALPRHRRHRGDPHGRRGGVLDGVTTNPTLYAKVGAAATTRSSREVSRRSRRARSAEVVADDVDGMLEEGRHFAKLAPTSWSRSR